MKTLTDETSPAPFWKKLAWFGLLWGGSVLALVVVALLLHGFMALLGMQG